MADREDLLRLIRHYEALYEDTILLIKYCGMRGVALDDGFRDVCDARKALARQLEGLKA